MTTKTPKPAPIPDRQAHPIQKRNSASAKTLPAVPVFQRLRTKEEDEIKSPIQKVKNNTGLPDNLKTGIENLSGFSMDDVKVHYNSDKPSQLNALAYAQGNNIHVAAIAARIDGIGRAQQIEVNLKAAAAHRARRRYSQVSPRFKERADQRIGIA